MKLINTITNIAVAFAKWCGISTAFVMTVMIFLQVVYRYVLGESLSFSEELARYIFIWVAFLGWVIASHNKSHIRISLVTDRSGPKLKLVLGLFSNLSVMAFAPTFEVMTTTALRKFTFRPEESVRKPSPVLQIPCSVQCVQ